MRKISFLVITLIVLFFAFLNREKLVNAIYYSPCDTPVEYKIGNIDSRFDVTASQLLDESKQAANIWNNSYGKTLLSYDPNAVLTINLVYDKRQELNSQINNINSDLKNQKSSLDPQIQAYQQKQADFEKRLDALNSEISYWNARGGAPQDEYDKLVSEQKELQQEANDLNNEAKQLGQSTNDYNANIGKLSQTVNNYQQVLNSKPEEGLYEQIGTQKTIDIYIDTNRDEFLHTLAHEMGHALGLDHNSNPDSIMYAQTTTKLTPTVEDMQALNEVCKKRTVFQTIYDNYSQAFSYFITKTKTPAGN